MLEIQTCLKSELLGVQFQTVWNFELGLDFLSLDFRQCVKSELFGNQTVIECLKAILVWILDTHCRLNFVNGLGFLFLYLHCSRSWLLYYYNFKSNDLFNLKTLAKMYIKFHFLQCNERIFK